MKVYLDGNYRCHAADTGGLREKETAFFDGRSPDFIAGYCYIPEGETWTDPQGRTLTGGSVFPWKPFSELAEEQQRYLLQQELREAENTIAELVEMIYEADLEVIG